jgi:hypothetical protein
MCQTVCLLSRAKTLHNFKSELNLEREEGMYQRESTRSYIKTAENTVCEYIQNVQSSSLFDSESNKNLHHISFHVLHLKPQKTYLYMK